MIEHPAPTRWTAEKKNILGRTSVHTSVDCKAGVEVARTAEI